MVVEVVDMMRRSLLVLWMEMVGWWDGWRGWGVDGLMRMSVAWRRMAWRRMAWRRRRRKWSMVDG